MKLQRREAISAACLALVLSGLSCAKGEVYEPPEAPAMPAGWQQLKDSVADRNKLGEFEYRLEGKMKGVRITLYAVNGKRVQLNTIVPRDDVEADKIYRILANKRPMHSYLRKPDRLYEFIGAVESADDIERGSELLSK
jgi:hypothetical protein